MSEKKNLLTLTKTFLLVSIFLLGVAGGYFYFFRLNLGKQIKRAKQDVYLAFTEEVFEKISQNFWRKMTEEELAKLFVLAIEKLTGQPQTLKANNKASLLKQLTEISQQIESDEKKKEFFARLADLTLANLEPFGRSRLYTKKEEISLKNKVENINPEVDQYAVLGVEKEASQEEIEKAFKEKKKSPGVEQAYKVLSDPEARQVYDLSGVEPTMDYRLITPKIFYLHWKKFSPTTFDELKRVTKRVADREGLDTLILDLRDNVGGAIDGLPYFLGPFIGQNQYAYQFYHQGKRTDFKTKIGWLPSLVRYKKVVILINQGTQSSAEVMAATLKKYHVGVTLGTTTKGWGTVEKIFPLENQINPGKKHSIFLAHSLTLRDDGQPIEGRGVEPLIKITDPDWENQLFAYFHYPELIKAVKEVISTGS